MMHQEKVSIVCPCGKLLKSQMSTERTHTKGTLGCPACKKRVQYAIDGFNCFTNYSR